MKLISLYHTGVLKAVQYRKTVPCTWYATEDTRVIIRLISIVRDAVRSATYVVHTRFIVSGVLYKKV